MFSFNSCYSQGLIQFIYGECSLECGLSSEDSPPFLLKCHAQSSVTTLRFPGLPELLVFLMSRELTWPLWVTQGKDAAKSG